MLPDAFAGIGGYFYLVIADFCLFLAGLAHFYYVETADHSLVEIAIAFGDKAVLENHEQVMSDAGLEQTSVYTEKKWGSISALNFKRAKSRLRGWVR